MTPPAPHLPAGAAPEPGSRYPLVTVGVLIVGPSERVLLIRTHKWGDRWGIPGGKVDYGETLLAAAQREVREETALELSELYWAPVQEAVEHPQFHRPAHFVLLNFIGRAKGEAVVLNDEAQEYRWVAAAEGLEFDLNTPTRALLKHYLAHGTRSPRLIARPELGATQEGEP